MRLHRNRPCYNAHLVTRILSVDVEDYFHVEAFSDVVERSAWDDYECRVESNTYRLLEMFDRRGVRATFFILGWVAERYPSLVRDIVAAGHEPACHSYWHRLIYTLTPEDFRSDTYRAKQVIEQAAGTPVYGYRAPSYSITRKSIWALDVLAELGFTYDSSIFPIHHDVYGIPDAPRSPFQTETPSGPITEYPITTFRLFGEKNLPVGGGGYLRIFPYWYTRLGVSRAERDGVPLVVYLHPWEIDPEQPRLSGRLTSRLRHYTNLSRMQKRLDTLLNLGQFGSFRESDLIQASAARPTLHRKH
jgi:polysaccharide deacetylase family protein (PEP-CTERM system associated)